jgi:hypothetical protein
MLKMKCKSCHSYFWTTVSGQRECSGLYRNSRNPGYDVSIDTIEFLVKTKKEVIVIENQEAKSDDCSS